MIIAKDAVNVRLTVPRDIDRESPKVGIELANGRDAYSREEAIADGRRDVPLDHVAVRLKRLGRDFVLRGSRR